MKPLLLVAICTGFLGGCSSMSAIMPFSDDNSASEEPHSEQLGMSEAQAGQLSSSAISTSAEFNGEVQQRLLTNQPEAVKYKLQELAKKPHGSAKDINYYVRGLMQDLAGNLQYVNNTTPVAVTSFVLLDSDYTKTNLIGTQMAESVIHEVHKLGIPVIDFKTTDYIRVTSEGDFIFSKDYEDLNGDSPIRYVVGGTLVKYNDGYLVNARMVGIDSKAVVGSAQSFIPNNVVSAMMSNEKSMQEVEANKVTAKKTIVQG